MPFSGAEINALFEQDGDMEPPSEEIRVYQETLRANAADRRLKNIYRRFKETITKTRDDPFDDENPKYVFSAASMQRKETLMAEIHFSYDWATELDTEAKKIPIHSSKLKCLGRSGHDYRLRRADNGQFKLSETPREDDFPLRIVETAKGRPEYVKTSSTGDLGKARYLDRVKRWDEAHQPPSVVNTSVKHLMRADDRVQAFNGREYPLTKSVAKTVEKKERKKERGESKTTLIADSRQKDTLDEAIQKWDRFIIDHLDRGGALRYNVRVEGPQTAFVERVVEEEAFSQNRRKTVRPAQRTLS